MISIKQFYSLHQNGLKKLFLFLPIFIFGLIEWQLNNRFFSVFIVLFFIVALFLEHRRYFVLIITTTLVFITFNTLTFENLTNFQKIELPFIQHPKQTIIELFSPNTGTGFFPNQIRIMSSLLQSNYIETYRLSDEFKNNDEIVQHIIGLAWPIKLEDTSPYILIGTDEIQNYKDCAIIKQKEDVILVDCQ